MKDLLVSHTGASLANNTWPDAHIAAQWQAIHTDCMEIKTEMEKECQLSANRVKLLRPKVVKALINSVEHRILQEAQDVARASAGPS